MMQQPTPQENRMPRADQPMQQPRAAHTDPAGESTAELAPARGHRNVRVAGRWYYVVMIATAGMFAWVPFLHAATRLKTAKARKLALIFGGLDALMYVLLAITPQDSQGHTASGPISTVGGLLALGTIIVGCIMLAPLRRMAYESAPIDAEDRQSNGDPAIKAVLATRARRDEARKLAANDPLLARELHIGRPDLTRTYDDGGLVDLNSAPAKVIAETCGIPTEVAATIVDARNQRGEPFSNVDELFVITDLPVTTWDRIRDRAVLLPGLVRAPGGGPRKPPIRPPFGVADQSHMYPRADLVGQVPAYARWCLDHAEPGPRLRAKPPDLRIGGGARQEIRAHAPMPVDLKGSIFSRSQWPSAVRHRQRSSAAEVTKANVQRH
jgi:hypothetical protein